MTELSLNYIYKKTKLSYKSIIQTEDEVEHLDIPVQNSYRILAHTAVKQYERWFTKRWFDEDKYVMSFVKHLMCIFEK